MSDVIRRVVKADRYATGPQPANVYRITDLEERAREYLLGVQADLELERQQMLAEVQAERGRVFEDARREGLANGIEEGERLLSERVETALAERMRETVQRLEPLVTEVVSQLAADRERIESTWQNELIHLALRISGMLIGRSLEVSPEVVADRVGQAIRMTLAGNPASIHVNPDDLELIEASVAESFGSFEGLTFVPDTALQRGDSVLRSADGLVDARLETQLAQIVAELIPGERDESHDEGV